MPSYQLAISNIAWQKDDDETVYAATASRRASPAWSWPRPAFSPNAPYENLTSALLFGGYLKNRWGFSVPSLQSIWYGQKAISLTLSTPSTCWTTRRRRSSLPTA